MGVDTAAVFALLVAGAELVKAEGTGAEVGAFVKTAFIADDFAYRELVSKREQVRQGKVKYLG